MFIPVGDSPNPRDYRPWVTHGLIALNIAVFLVFWPQAFRRADSTDPTFRQYVTTLSREPQMTPDRLRESLRRLTVYDLTIFRHGFRPASPDLKDVLTAMFLHGGLSHLMGNMLFLWIFGDNLEFRLGRSRYLWFYLLTGLAAAGGDAMIRWGSSIPSVGASGAISGVLGGYFVWFPYNRVRVWMLFFPVIELPARFVLGFYILVQNVLPLMLKDGTGGGVSYGAHVGGFIAGAAAVALMNRRLLTRPDAVIGAAVRARTADQAMPGETFRAALDQGRLIDAAGLLFSSSNRHGLAVEDELRLGAALAGEGHGRTALAVCQLILREHPGTAFATEAHILAARVLLVALQQPTAAFQHVQAALTAAVVTVEQETELRRLLDELSRVSDTLPRFR